MTAGEPDALVPRCGAGRVRFIGDLRCRLCPDHTQCLSQQEGFNSEGNSILNLSVEAGYWRFSLYAGDVMACTPSKACEGGTGSGQCSAGYSGPMCGLCNTDYGRSIIGGDCVECMDKRLAMALLAFVCAVVLAIVVVSIVAAVQNPTVDFDSIVIFHICVSHLHSILGVGLLGFPFPQFFKDAMSYTAIFSVRILDYYFSDCALSSEGLTYYTKVVLFSLVPAGALICASCAWLVMFLFPDFAKHTKRPHNRLTDCF